MKKRGFLLVLVLVVVVGFAAYFVFTSDVFSSGKPKLVAVEEGNVDVTIVANGELVAKDFIKVAASTAFRSKSDVIGQVRIKTIVPEGKVVRSGEPIALLDRESIVNAIKAAELEAADLSGQAQRALSDTVAQLRDVRYNLSTLRINMEISQINMEQSFYDPPAAQKKSKLEFEKSKIAYDQAYQNMKFKMQQIADNAVALQAKAENAAKKPLELRKLLGAVVVRAPRSGVVTYYTDLSGNKRQAGSIITPDDLTVALIPNSSSFYSTFELPEGDLAKVKLMQDAKVRIPLLENTSFNGRIEEISGFPRVVDGKKLYTVMVRIHNSSQELRPMMSSINDLRLTTLNNVLYLPQKAIVAEQGKHYVYTEDKRKQEVALGGSNSELVAIVKGLKKGEEIFLSRPEKVDSFILKQL
ncbi:efflux RND transporter periplasmic adaptor subunit [uncultured Acetobacteroides sp.]|uniref:efflux RND transporter periplasmic adaptor subunit n=1 Tax=uncultured Acetobacteroides sp. TaxID=1760811 RepID=UPI0029F4DBD7|nr:efflux RND transporter periplasmic adaptor subunit [uncultured Acetobacteroides sp.]